MFKYWRCFHLHVGQRSTKKYGTAPREQMRYAREKGQPDLHGSITEHAVCECICLARLLGGEAGMANGQISQQNLPQRIRLFRICAANYDVRCKRRRAQCPIERYRCCP